MKFPEVGLPDNLGEQLSIDDIAQLVTRVVYDVELETGKIQELRPSLYRAGVIHSPYLTMISVVRKIVQKDEGVFQPKRVWFEGEKQARYVFDPSLLTQLLETVCREHPGVARKFIHLHGVPLERVIEILSQRYPVSQIRS